MTMLIVDAHQDIAHNALKGRDFTLPVQEIRRCEAEAHPLGGHDLAMVSLPELLAGQVGIVFATLFAEPIRGNPWYDGGPAYTTLVEAHALARRQLDYYRGLAAADPRVRLLTNQRELLAFRQAWNAAPGQLLGIVVLMEGADPITTPEQASDWYTAGVRLVGPAWRRTQYCGGTGDPGPLTSAGRRLMVEMTRAGLVLDIAHLAEESVWQALDLFPGPVIASHANCRALLPTDRHLSDEMIRAIVARNGVIGVALYNAFIQAGWRRGMSKEAVTLADLVRHVDHICQLAGDTTHVGLGSDLDGGFGRDQTPAGLDTVADLRQIADALQAAGYKASDIANIMGENWYRFLSRTLPA